MVPTLQALLVNRVEMLAYVYESMNGDQKAPGVFKIHLINGVQLGLCVLG